MLAFIDPESRSPTNHTRRTIEQFADAALAELSPQFDRLYAADGLDRPSIPPERLLKASLLMSLFSVRSERAFCESLDRMIEQTRERIESADPHSVRDPSGVT
jgi:hypothetical protein